MSKQGDMRVWWVPQVPMQAFTTDVQTAKEGWKLVDVLARYDTFQFENNIKPDYCNAGGVQEWLRIDGEGDWYDLDEEEGEDE